MLLAMLSKKTRKEENYIEEILTKEDLEEIFNEADEDVAPVNGLWEYTIHHNGFYINDSGDVVVDLTAEGNSDDTFYSLVLSADHPADSIEEVFDAIFECGDRQNIGDKARCLKMDVFELSLDPDALCMLLRNYLNCFDYLFEGKKIDTTGIGYMD